MTQPPRDPGPDYGGWAPPPPHPPSGPYPARGQQPWPAAPPAKPRARRGLIATIVAVLALVGGGVASYVAFADSSAAGGAASPKAAVQNLVADLNNSDFLGVLDDLPPGERDALAQPARDQLDQLKRLHVLSANANGDSVSGFSFTTRNLAYASNPTVINDHVQTVAVTGGTIDVSTDAAKLPFTSEFARLTDPHGATHQHVDIAAAERRTGHPLWIATQQVDNRWYPSLFYTIAANATHDRVPTAADHLPAVGASSPQDVVRMLLRDLMRGDVRSALTLASPDELAVLHDYGGLITQSLPSFGQSHVSVKTLDLTTVPLSGGAVRVVLHRLALATPNGPVSVSVAGSCYRVSTRDQSRRICADQLPFSGLSGTESCSGGVRIDRNGHRHRYGQNCTHTKTTLPPAQKRALTDLFSSVTKVGVVTTQTGGRWFLAPVRTVSDLGSVLLSGLRGNDLLELIKLGK